MITGDALFLAPDKTSERILVYMMKFLTHPLIMRCKMP